MKKKLVLAIVAATMMALSASSVLADDMPPLVLYTYLPLAYGGRAPEFPPCNCVPGEPCVCR